MGAWGPGTFENDAALDWLGDFLEGENTSAVRSALNKIVDHGGTKSSPPSIIEKLRGRGHHIDWLTANVASKGLAAAEVVASWLGHPPTKERDDIKAWLQQHSSSFQTDLIPLAIEAVKIVETNSELKDLWEEGDSSKWKEVIADLERRLHLPMTREG